MNEFNDPLHTMTLSEDGSYTAYSKEYDEHYHSTKDGALHESLTKHVIPAFSRKKNQDEIYILDICFGLGFNTLATLYYAQENKISSKINIFSPELDKELIASLNDFTYPKEFEGMQTVIADLLENGVYKDEQFHIELFLGDAREYILKFEDDYFDVIYQDAFSPSTNPILWTKEYFEVLSRIIKKDGLVTTYSTALATRLALYQNGFNVYINKGEDFRNATLASLGELEGVELVDMEHKISCNPDVKPLMD